MPETIASQQSVSTPLPTLDQLADDARLKAGVSEDSVAGQTYLQILPSVKQHFAYMGRAWGPNVKAKYKNIDQQDFDLQKRGLEDVRLDETSASSSQTSQGLGKPFFLMCSALCQELKSALPEQSDGTRMGQETELSFANKFTSLTCSQTITPETTYLTLQPGSEDKVIEHRIKSSVTVVGAWCEDEEDERSDDEGSVAAEVWKWFVKVAETSDPA